MPGLAGIVNKSLQSPLDSTLKGMLENISEGWYQVDKYVDEGSGIAIGRADLGIVNAETQPYSSPDATLRIFLYGDVYFPKSIIGEKNNAVDTLSLISDNYHKQGIEFVSELAGEFFVAILDTRRKIFYLCNDRFGRRPVYYSNYNNGLCYSSEIKSILSVPGFAPVVDQDALSQFLTFGYVLGNDTLLSNVSLLPPAGILRFSLETSEVDISTYWDLRDNLSPIESADSIILEQLTDLFKSAVNKRLSRSHLVGISLSGGMDSRAIAAVADPEEYPIKSVTSGLAGCIDEKVTAKIASVSGFEHIFYEFDDQLHRLSHSENSELIREAIIRTDGMRGASSSAMTAFSARKWREHGLDTVITGHGGELAKLDKAYGFSISNFSELEKNSDEFLDWSFRRMSQASAPRVDKPELFQGSLLKSILDSPKARLAEILGNLDANLPVAQKTSFLFLNELFRKRALYALSIHKSYAEIRLPFYDDDFLKLLVRTRYQVRTNNRVHSHIINSCRPELLNIKLSDTRMRPNPGLTERIFIGLPFRIMKKLGYYKKDSPEAYFQANSDPEFFKSILLDDKSIERGYLNPKTLNSLIGECAQGRGDVYHLLHLLVISEIWHREYIDR
jgi:asparagine synthase (glutamine-hydrolysing)